MARVLKYLEKCISFLIKILLFFLKKLWKIWFRLRKNYIKK